MMVTYECQHCPFRTFIEENILAHCKDEGHGDFEASVISPENIEERWFFEIVVSFKYKTKST